MKVEIFPVGITYGTSTIIAVFLVVKDKNCYMIGNEGLGAWHEDIWQLTRKSFRDHYEQLFARVDEIRKEKGLSEPVMLSSEAHGGDHVLSIFSRTFLKKLRKEAEQYLRKTGHWESNVMVWRDRIWARSMGIR